MSKNVISKSLLALLAIQRVVACVALVGSRNVARFVTISFSLIAVISCLPCNCATAQGNGGALENLPPPVNGIAVQPAPLYSQSLMVRIKDITRLEGARTNKLTGMGLVTGLNGTGSKNPVTRQFAMNMMERFDLRGDPDERANIRSSGLDKTDNLSVVTVTADVDVTRHKVGNPIDIMVSTFDDASNLQGGVLVLTPLYGVDGEVYAVASGPISTGGFSFSGDAASVQQNHPTTGRIINGATIEKSVCEAMYRPVTEFRLNVISPDLETSRRIENAVNQRWPGHARMFDAGAVDLRVPSRYASEPNRFITEVQAIHVVPDQEARVIINERTGTIIVGENVRLSRVAISHGNLSVVTGESPQISQPAPFSQGQTAAVPRTNIEVTEGLGAMAVIDQPVTVGDLARALNSLGVTPRDLSSIFQQLKVSGALHAKLIFQ